MSVTYRMIQTVTAVCAVLLASCAVNMANESALNNRPLAPGDTVQVFLVGEDDLSATYVVGEDGVLPLPLVGEVPAAGLTTAQLEAQLLRTLASGYLSNPQLSVTLIPENVLAQQRAQQRANVLLDERLEALREEVDADEAAIRKFRAGADLAAITEARLAEERTADLASQIEQTRTDLANAEARLEAAEARAEADDIREAQAGLPFSMRQVELLGERTELEQEREELAAQHSDDHPELQRVERELAELNAGLQAESRRIAIAQQNQVAMNRARLQSLQSAQSQSEANLAEGRNQLARLRELEREAEASRSAYDALLARANSGEGDPAEPRTSRDQTEGNTEQARREIDALRNEVEIADRALERYRSEAGLSADTDGAAPTEQSLAQQTAELADRRARLEEREKRLLEGRVVGGAVTADGFDGYTEELAEFGDISSEEFEALPTDDQVELAQGYVDDTAAERERVAVLAIQLEQQKAQLAAREADFAELAELERNAEAARSQYETALMRYRELADPPPPASRPSRDGDEALAATEDSPEASEPSTRSLFGGLFGTVQDRESTASPNETMDALLGGVRGALATCLAQNASPNECNGSIASPLAIASVEAGPLGVGGVEGVKVLPPMSLVEPETLLDDGSNAVRLLFGTNREREMEGETTRLTPNRSQELLIGAVTVSVPTVPHVVGTVERPGEIPTPFGPVYTSAETPERHIMLRSGSFLTEREFAALAARIQRDARRFDNQALIFVHGFNNGFEDVAYRTAQIVHDLQFDGAAYFYSWPSKGELSRASYRYDRESVLASRAPFREFLELVSETTNADKIHVVAHSMGTLLTMEVLRDINQERRRRQGPLFAEVVLAAPDIDRDVFMELADEINGIAEGVTVYASAVDTALQISEQLAGRMPRAGGIGPQGPVVVTGIDTIDATAVSTDLFYALNHARFAEATAIIDDLDELLREGRRPPELRTPLIEPVTVSDAVSYWRFRALPK